MASTSVVHKCEKYRNCCIAINNWSEEEYNTLFTLPYSYIVVGKEHGKENNTPHLQVYVEFKKQVPFSWFKKNLPRAHIEPRFSQKAKAAADYCKKEGDFVEMGQLSEQGKRTDLIRLYSAVKEGTTYRELLTAEAPNAQELRCIDKAFTYLEKPRNFKTEVIWITGPTGCGKTRYATETYPDAYMKDDTKWWDGYDRHETVIWDDYRGSHMKFSTLLKLLDRYEFRGEVKGGYRQIVPKTIVITSIFKPEDCYNQEPEPIKQLLRRIDQQIEMVSDEDRIKNRMSGNTKPTSSINIQEPQL